MTHSYVCHDSFIRVPRFILSVPGGIHIYVYVYHDPFTCVRVWPGLQRKEGSSYVCHDYFIRVPWLLNICQRICRPESQEYETYESRVSVMWEIMCLIDIRHVILRYEKSAHVCVMWVTSLSDVRRHVSHWHETCDSKIWEVSTCVCHDSLIWDMWLTSLFGRRHHESQWYETHVSHWHEICDSQIWEVRTCVCHVSHWYERRDARVSLIWGGYDE